MRRHEEGAKAGPRATLPRIGRAADGPLSPIAVEAVLDAPGVRWPTRTRPGHPTTPEPRCRPDRATVAIPMPAGGR
jgi:hypothetical protein